MDEMRLIPMLAFVGFQALWKRALALQTPAQFSKRDIRIAFPQQSPFIYLHLLRDES